MLLYIDWNPSQELFGTIRWYSLLWCIGLVAAYFIVHKAYRQQKISEAQFEPLFFYCFIGTLVGARLGHCLFYEPGYYLTSTKGFIEMFLPIHFNADMSNWKFTGYEGLASHGGTIGIILMMMLYAKLNKVKMLTVIDNVALAVPLVSCCIRLGNLMNSEIIGKITDVPWAFIFHCSPLVHGQFPPRHPAQLYEAIAYLIIFFVQLYIYKKHDLPLYPKTDKFVASEIEIANKKSYIGKGFYFGFTIATIFIFRFFIEFLKEDQVDFEKGMTFDMGQLLSIPFCILGVWLIWRAMKLSRKVTGGNV